MGNDEKEKKSTPKAFKLEGQLTADSVFEDMKRLGIESLDEYIELKEKERDY